MRTDSAAKQRGNAGSVPSGIRDEIEPPSARNRAVENDSDEMSPEPRPRAPFQRAASGALSRSLVHPLQKGKRYQITARTVAELDEIEARVKSVGRDVKLGLRDRDEALRALERRASGSPYLLDIWSRYTDEVAGDPLKHDYRTKLGSVWRHHLASAFEGARVSDLTADAMKGWTRSMLGRDYSPTTIRMTVDTIGAALTHAGEALPWGAWRPPPVVAQREYEKANTIAELAQLLRAACARDVATARAGKLADLTWRIVVVVLVGLRKGEAAGLGWDALDLASSVATIRLRFQATNQWRKVHPTWTRPLAPLKQRGTHGQVLHKLAILVLAWQQAELERRGWYRADGPVFPTEDGCWRPNAQIILWSTWRALVDEAKLPNARDWVVHSLRHSMASLEDVGGASLEDIRRRTGHGSLAMVARYVQRTKRHMPESRIAVDRTTSDEPALAYDEVSLLEVLLECREKIADAYALAPMPSAERSERAELFEARAKLGAEYLALCSLGFAELARAMQERGAPVRLISRAAKRRRDLAYARARRTTLAATGDPRAANAAACEASAAAWKVWKKALSRARIAHAAEEQTRAAKKEKGGS